MIGGISGLLRGTRESKHLVARAPQRGRQLVGAEVQNTRLRVGAQAALLRREGAPLVGKLGRGGLGLHGITPRRRWPSLDVPRNRVHAFYPPAPDARRRAAAPRPRYYPPRETWGCGGRCPPQTPAAG